MTERTAPTLYGRFDAVCPDCGVSINTTIELNAGIWRGGKVLTCESCAAVLEVVVSIEYLGKRLKEGEDG